MHMRRRIGFLLWLTSLTVSGDLSAVLGSYSTGEKLFDIYQDCVLPTWLFDKEDDKAYSEADQKFHN